MNILLVFSVVGFVFQVLGALKGYGKVEYVIGGKGEKSRLSSIAIYKYFASKGGSWRLIFFAPESLASNIAEDVDDAKRLLEDKEVFVEKVYFNLKDVVSECSNYEVKPMQSIGEYRSSKNFVLKFDNSIDNVKGDLFLTFIDLINDEKDVKIIFDVSTGLNIYVAAFLDSLRSCIVYKKLSDILQGGKGISVELAFSEPVMRGTNRVNVTFHEYDVKAFFELPIGKKEMSSVLDFLKVYGREKEHLVRKLVPRGSSLQMKRCLSSLRKSFNALKYNVPLTFLYDDVLGFDENIGERVSECRSILRKLVENIEKQKEIKLESTTGGIEIIHVKRIPINSKPLINLFFSISLLEGIARFWKRNFQGKDPNEGISLEDLERIFSNVYDSLHLGLNKRFLSRDLTAIRNIANGLKDEEETVLRDLKHQNEQLSKSRQIVWGDEKRNFFAHSGLLDNYTLIKKKGGRIFLKYTLEHFREKLKGWLKNPED